MAISRSFSPLALKLAALDQEKSLIMIHGYQLTMFAYSESHGRSSKGPYMAQNGQKRPFLGHFLHLH